MGNKFDAIIIGMGPSGIFCAYELIKLGKAKNILLLEQGKRVENRNCPISKTGKCLKCKPFCNITSGFSGAGAFSDGKLSLYNPKDDDIHIGGDLHKYIGTSETKKLIDYTDKIYLDFGADEKLEGVNYPNEIENIYRKAKKEGINLISIPIRHLGTEKSHELYKNIETFLELNGINMMFETSVEDLIVKENTIYGVVARNVKTDEYTEYYSNNIVSAIGRKGANWLSQMCEKHKIETCSGTIDIGVRYELPDLVMKDINKYMYEGKFIGKPFPFKDKVRTFCQNPSGFVSSEVYDNNMTLVNGHSYKDIKSNNTNLAILVSHNFTYPFNKPIEYGRNVAKNLNELGAGNVMVQRLGDIYRGRRTWEKDLEKILLFLL